MAQLGPFKGIYAGRKETSCHGLKEEPQIFWEAETLGDKLMRNIGASIGLQHGWLRKLLVEKGEQFQAFRVKALPIWQVEGTGWALIVDRATQVRQGWPRVAALQIGCWATQTHSVKNWSDQDQFK
eukprot:1160102-Pelagomonas_calceolata.AAC.2